MGWLAYWTSVTGLTGAVMTTTARPIELLPVLDFLPRSALETWERWLGWRLPHFNVMETRAASTLSGSKFAKVRVGWNGSSRTPADWHVTLFTRTRETLSPDRTAAAIADIKPAGFVFHHVMTVRSSRCAATPPDPTAAPLTQQIQAAMLAAKRYRDLANDSLVQPLLLEAVRQSTVAQLDDARAATEAAITAGLVKRTNFTLRPLAVIKSSMLQDRILYQLLLHLRLQLMLEREPVPWRPEGVAVCETCAMVFKPRRRRTAALCDFCQGGGVEPQVFGEKPLAPGQLQTFRAPRTDGNLLLGWKTASMGFCDECGEVFVAQRRDARACERCSPKLRQRRLRHRRADTDDQSS
jgi:hypothetical protein